MAAGDPFVTFMHTPCFYNSYISHSTMLAIGRTKQGSAFALFFDAHGAYPSQSTLVGTMAGAWEGLTVEELYEDLTRTMEVKPSLFFSTSNIQADIVSGTAYTALFQDQLMEAFLTGNFSPEAFMQSIANDQALSFFRVRQVIASAFAILNLFGGPYIVPACSM